MKKIKAVLFLVPSILCLVAVIAGFKGNMLDLKYPIFPKLNAVVKGEETFKEKNRRGMRKTKADNDSSKIKKAVFVSNGKYKDGVYLGEAEGYGGLIKVSVTIKKEKIDSIDVTDHSGETESYYKSAEKIIPRILKEQSPNVDTISGATYSSNGIKNAVIMALNKASGKSTANVDGKKTKTNDKKTNKNSKKEGVPADGIFLGKSICDKFGYTVSLKVKFLKGKAVAITSLKLINNDDKENVPYCKKAWKPTIKNIIKKQSGEVDTVSGATYSSNAIKDAFIDAQNKAIEANGGIKKRKNKNHKEPQNNDKKNIMEDEKIDENKVIKDGTYSVTVLCNPDEDEEFKAYHLTAKVMFKNGKLISISNLSSDAESNKKYYQWAANGRNSDKGMIEQLLNKQSANGLSAVSGATCSSIALKKIYINAIKMAQGEKTQSDTIEVVKTQKPVVQDKSNSEDKNRKKIQTSAWVYAMEDEYGDYDFDDYELFANVVFEDGILSDIEIISCGSESNRFYCEKAVSGTPKLEGMISKFLRMGVDKADVVSGATCTSDSLKIIYKKAMEKYKE